MAYEVQDKQAVKDWNLATEEELIEGYRAMAADEEREAEALAWCEGLGTKV